MAIVKDRFRTRHTGLAAMLLYTGKLQISVFVEDSKQITFEFYDPDGECRTILSHFFSTDGAQVADARALLEANRAVKKSMTFAIESENGRWDNPLLNQTAEVTQ